MRPKLEVRTKGGERLALMRLDGYWFRHLGHTFTVTWNPMVALWEVAHIHELTGIPARMTKAVEMEAAVQAAMESTDTLARTAARRDRLAETETKES
jgi:hypothetical protein